MKILIIDGMGGGIGKAVIERIRAAAGDKHQLLAIGTNAIATTAMHRAGAHQAATGENAVIYNSGRSDIIIGSIGIAFANAMLGEISPAMAAAVSSSGALKILIPTSKCNAVIPGLKDQPTAHYIDEIPAILDRLEGKQNG
jgi:hypothetical protein